MLAAVMGNMPSCSATPLKAYRVSAQLLIGTTLWLQAAHPPPSSALPNPYLQEESHSTWTSGGHVEGREVETGRPSREMQRRSRKSDYRIERLGRGKEAPIEM